MAADKDVDFEPLWDFVLMDPIPNNKSEGGLVLPDGARISDCSRSVIVKAGPGAYRDDGTFVPNPLKVGDTVYHLAMMQPYKVILGGHLYLCISAKDAVATAKRKEGGK